MKKLYYTSFFYLILGMVSGIFSREYTKLNDFSGITNLGAVHSHILVLGFLFFLILALTHPILNLSEHKGFFKWYVVYNLGLLWTVIALSIRGIIQVIGTDIAGLNHIAGTGHAILGVALIWFMLLAKKALFNKNTL